MAVLQVFTEKDTAQGQDIRQSKNHFIIFQSILIFIKQQKSCPVLLLFLQFIPKSGAACVDIQVPSIHFAISPPVCSIHGLFFFNLQQASPLRLIFPPPQQSFPFSDQPLTIYIFNLILSGWSFHYGLAWGFNGRMSFLPTLFFSHFLRHEEDKMALF